MLLFPHLFTHLIGQCLRDAVEERKNDLAVAFVFYLEMTRRPITGHEGFNSLWIHGALRFHPYLRF